MTAPPKVLSIAGSDPSGGAGVQADLKTFSALGAYGCAAMTALTAQSTRGVTGVHVVPAEFVREQVETLVEDVRLDAVKIGMLATAGIVDTVADLVRDVLDCPVVLDPVMVSTAGSRLLDEDAVAAMVRLLPHASLITPNLPEAAVLLGADPAEDLAGMTDQARALRELGVPRVLVKGGHRESAVATDVWVDEEGTQELTADRVDTVHTHGTGCTLSSAIAALLPQHDGWVPAVDAAKTWLTGALENGHELEVGNGPGPVHHFYRWW